MTECVVGQVAQVTIATVDNQAVSFWTRSASKSGDPAECLRRLFSVARSQLWTDVISGQPAAVALTPGASGPLYLTEDGWKVTSADGFRIYGADTSANVLKLPSCLGVTEEKQTLTVIPSKVVVQGYPSGQQTLVEIDLLGPEAAESQDIEWLGAEPLAIRIAPSAAHAHAVDAKGMLSLWPTRIVVTGCAKSAPLTPGHVDLLDGELADVAQRLTFHKPVGELSLVLTQDGFGAFHVIPGM